MLLTLSTTHQPATDLGYLLGKNPAHAQTFTLAYGVAHVFYPEASDHRCTAALLLDVDPVGLVRGRTEQTAQDEYVNDRPYVASSFFAVAIAQVWRSALGGSCRERPELAKTKIALEARLVSVPCRGGEAILRRLFEPLGYAMTITHTPLDRAFPEWGDSPYFEVGLSATTTVAELLTHLYVLVPVLDDDKHYWVGDDEVEKLVAKGEGWLGAHPDRELIALRYLKHRRSLSRKALARLEGDVVVEEDDEQAPPTPAKERKARLEETRHQRVHETLVAHGAARVLDVGCGEGKLLRRLLRDRSFTTIAGCDVSPRALEICGERLDFDRMTEAQRERIRVFQASVTYRDKRFEGYDALALVEVIEHLDPSRLGALEAVVFGHAKPRVVLVTTPNAEVNVTFENLPAGSFRHSDHRFEWNRNEFQDWAQGVAARHGYAVAIAGIGEAVADLGEPTQMAIFTRDAAKEAS